MTSLESFQSLSNQILSGRYSMTDEAWTGAIDHFTNVIKFRLDPVERAKWHQTAINYIKKELSAIINDFEIPSNDPIKAESMSKWVDIDFKTGYYNSAEFLKLVNETRQKLVFVDYVKTNLSK